MYCTEHSELGIERQHGRKTREPPLPARLFHKQQKRHRGALKSPLLWLHSLQARLTLERTPHTLLSFSLLPENRVLFSSPGQLTISKPSDPSSSKYQLHQVAQLKGLGASALVTSDGSQDFGEGKKGYCKKILHLARKKSVAKRRLDAGVLGLSGEVSYFRTLLTNYSILINWWKWGQNVKKCEVSVPCPCGRQFNRQFQNWAIVSTFDQRVTQNPLPTYEIFKVKKNPKIWCLVVAKPK